MIKIGINRLHSQHIRKICRGESRLERRHLFLVNGDDYSGQIGVLLGDHVYDIICTSRHLDEKSWSPYVCNYKTEEPIFWFNCYNEEMPAVYFLIGVRLNDLVRLLLNCETKSSMVWGVGVGCIFSTFVEHLKWRLEQEGVKYTADDFRGIRLVRDFRAAYSTKYYRAIGDIFAKVLKRLSNGK